MEEFQTTVAKVTRKTLNDRSLPADGKHCPKCDSPRYGIYRFAGAAIKGKRYCYNCFTITDETKVTK